MFPRIRFTRIISSETYRMTFLTNIFRGRINTTKAVLSGCFSSNYYSTFRPLDRNFPYFCNGFGLCKSVYGCVNLLYL